ncbi:MAG: hypothetical protein R6V49_04380 [Bacteroidales bacterium]
MKRIIVLALLFCTLASGAQVNQELRREFPVSDDFENFNVALFGAKGMMIFGGDKVSRLGKTSWKFLKTDQNLESLDSLNIELPGQLGLNYFEVDGDNLVLLFVSFKSRTYRLSILDFNTMKFNNFNGNLPRKLYLWEYGIGGNTLFLRYYQKKAFGLMTINLKTGASKQVPIKVTAGKKPWCENMVVDKESGEAFVYMNYYLKAKKTGTQAFVFDETGKRIETFTLAGMNDHNLTSITSTKMGPDHYVFMGTYSKTSSVTAEGFFISELIEGDRKFIKYYNFMNLENFTDYLPKKRQDKIAKKKEKSAARGKDLSYNFYMVSHPLLSVEDRYYFLGEFFYPTYRTETYQTYVNGRWVTQTRVVFDGYQYTHAVMASFDKEGEMVWDNCFEMWLDYKPMTRRMFVTATINLEGRIDLLFSSRKDIINKTFSLEGEKLREISRSGIDTGREDDKIKRSLSMMNYWYDGHFIAYGMQLIKDKGKSDGKKRRNVFFVNKISPE